MENSQFRGLDFIRTIPLPQSSISLRGYQAVSHMSVIDDIKEELDRKNIKIIKENYKIGREGNQLYGNFLTDINVDNEMSAAIHFINSYDKSKSFSINGGALVLVCTNGMMRMQSYVGTRRKHMGLIDSEMPTMIINAINTLEEEYNLLVEAKRRMVEIEVSNKIQAELIGRLFFEQEILTVTQMSMIKGAMNSRTNPFNNGNAWGFYNNVTGALRASHPSTYIKDHAEFHEFAMQEF
jgi:hypothetical protein